MDNYYDLSAVPLSDLNYEVTTISPPASTDMILSSLPNLDSTIVQTNDVVLAYQESEMYTAWRNGALLTNDKNVKSTNTLFCRVRGPFDTIPNNVGQSASGRYVRVEGYRNLTFKDQRDILVDVVGGKKYVNFKVRQTAVIYSAQPKFNTTDTQNLSFTCLFNVPSTATAVSFLNGYDNETASGLKIDAQFIRYFSDQPEGDLNLTITINSQVKNYTIANFDSAKWHAMVVSISNEFKQCGVYVYSIEEDPSDIINHNDFRRVFSSTSSLTQAAFDLTQYYTLPTSTLWIANLRLFSTMIKEEQHDFILSQQFIKDESMLLMIDNCRPQLNIPYIVKNR